ncbi:hypothetical protein BN946_scf184805.g4 [Trametes cinnabarina]|uniref:Uncharacterized protein n=1 Tax=Pycnoporus cinnabarinus TaxID=5643 RepID=A0A060S3E2_PYCCI|nr:hypothetical protein BN946_scf184805.g4 [Trametes cinnabarina]
MSARISTTKSSAALKPILKKAKLSVDATKPSKKTAAITLKARSEIDAHKAAPMKSKGKERAPSVETQTKRKKTATATTSDIRSSSVLPTTFKVICGSYEKLLYGLEGTVSLDGTEYGFHLEPIFIFPAHVSCIKTVAASPQGGKWLATGSADEIIKVWDLRRRKEIGGLMHHQEGELVRWSTDGTLFAVQAQNTIDVYSTEMDLLHNITHPSRLHDIKFCKRVDGDGELLLAGGEDKKLSIYEVPKDRTKEPTIIADMLGHNNRRKSTTVVCTISSDGKVRLFDLAKLPASSESKIELHPIAEYDTKGTRLTCVTLADGDLALKSVSSGKRKREEDQESEESDEEPEWTPQHQRTSGSEGEGESDDEQK